jgi:hypothetical protein
MKFANAGRKPQFDHETVLQETKNIDPNARRSIRSLAGALGIPRSTIVRMKQQKKLKVHTISLKPKLYDDLLLNRLYHCIYWYQWHTRAIFSKVMFLSDPNTTIQQGSGLMVSSASI